jgi:APA family basic amino acid/polyamine antiporter
MPLPRILNLRDLIWLVVGMVIGSGIFIVPAAVLRDVNGSFGNAMLLWAIAGVLSLLGGLTYGELSALHPEAGGLYIYIRDGFGRLAAFLFGWALFFVIGSGTIATLAVAFAAYCGEFVALTPVMSKLVAIGMVAALTAINVRGTRQGADLQNWTTIVKVAAIVIMGAALLVAAHFHPAAAAPAAAMHSGGGFAGIGAALLAILWAYEGWQYATYSAGEAINPERNFPRAFLAGNLILIAVYLLANFGYVAALGVGGAMGSDRVAATAVSVMFGPLAAKLIALAILISILSATNGNLLTTPRVFYAMAQDGLFFRRLAEVHPRFRTPAFSIVACAVWGCVLTFGGTFEWLLSYVIFAAWFFYALGAAALFVYRRRMAAEGRTGGYRVPGYPWTPLLFIAAAMGLVLNTIMTQPRLAAIGAGIVLLGLPAYFFWSRHGAPPTGAAQHAEK